MPTVEKRSVSLPSELAVVVDDAVASGEFGNASEVIREALRQWKDRRELHGYTVEELRVLWEEGLTSGPSPLTDLEALKAEGRRRLAERRTASRRA